MRQDSTMKVMMSSKNVPKALKICLSFLYFIKIINQVMITNMASNHKPFVES